MLRPEHAGDERGGEDAAGRAGRAVADLREHVGEHEHQQERLDQRARDERLEVLAQHDDVAAQQRQRTCWSRRWLSAVTPALVEGPRCVGESVVVVISRGAPCRSGG